MPQVVSKTAVLEINRLTPVVVRWRLRTDSANHTVGASAKVKYMDTLSRVASISSQRVALGSKKETVARQKAILEKLDHSKWDAAKPDALKKDLAALLKRDGTLKSRTTQLREYTRVLSDEIEKAETEGDKDTPKEGGSTEGAKDTNSNE